MPVNDSTAARLMVEFEEQKEIISAIERPIDTLDRRFCRL